MTTYEQIAEKWKVRNTIDEHRLKTNPFTKHETLAVINEKARMRGLTYGQYVLKRTFGYFLEDSLMNIKLNKEHRERFCKVTKRRTPIY